MALNTEAVTDAIFAHAAVIDADKTTRGSVEAMVAALTAYEAAKQGRDEGERSGLDRRTIKDRRIVSRAKQASEIADAICLVIVPPEDRAAQVERVYEAVPFGQRNEAGLTLAHVRLVLEALRQ